MNRYHQYFYNKTYIMIQVSMQNESLKFTNVNSTSLQKNILVWFTKKNLKKKFVPGLN